jgi:hypothetical protein
MAARAPVIAELIAEHHQGWPGPFVEDEIFGTHDPELLAAELAGLAGLVAAPVAAIFYEASVGIVAGLELADGRRLVVKVHQRRAVSAAATYILAYSARCEACGDPSATVLPEGSARAALAAHADAFLSP